ncbi:putative cytochrome P450 [Macrophomina phaseolina]|uniref:Cytochrome P450 n=1 Tax=Macrophomina phaseolina TaxID=35725 RepID=A0ABQ8GI01_9PEZI|nr:putative cytochrome P450 [Macrophomina phaseolina]
MGHTGVATWLTSAALGVAFHGFTQLGELDLVVPQTLGCLLTLALALFYADIQLFNATKADAAATVAVSAVGFLLSLTASTLIYRVFFHRLRKFPGPLGAKMSKFHSVYLSRNLQYHLEIEKLHKQYGDVVRTGPRELSVARISPLNDLITCRKSPFYSMSDRKMERQGLAFTTDFEDHRKRRRAWDISLTLQQTAKYDAPMQSMISLFLDRLSAPQQVGKPVDATEWISWLSYDIMGVVGYGKDFGNLRSAHEHAAVKGLREAMISFGVLRQVPWLGNFLAHFPGGEGPMGPFAKYCKDLVAEKRRALSAQGQGLESPTDIVTWLIKAFEEKQPYAAHTVAALTMTPAPWSSAERDDTSSATMVNILYYLCIHPHVMKTLQSELDAVFADGPASFTYEAVDRVPLPRVTPPEGLHIPAGKNEEGDLYIPGDTVVLQPQWLIQRDERYFERAEDFVPERWVPGAPEAKMVKERTAFFPFQVGMYHCVGKQLAIWEMKSVLARIALQFDVGFAPGEDGEAFIKGIKDTWTLTLPPLQLVFSKRKAGKA